MNTKSLIYSTLLAALSASAYADVGPDYVCQDKLEVKIPAPLYTIDYWTNVATSWQNTRSGEIELFVRGPGLVTARTEITGQSKDQRWLVPVTSIMEGQGIFVTFDPSECQAIGSAGRYCFRGRREDKTPILAAGLNEFGTRLTYREYDVKDHSVQAIMTSDQTLVSYLLPSGERVTLGLSCDSQEWYAHVPRDELNRTDL